METRLTKIETELPHLRDSLDKNTKSNEKMTEVLSSLEKTMIQINYKTETQEGEIRKNEKDIKEVKVKVEELEEKDKFDISNWIKSNWPWILITLTLGIGWATNIIGG